MKRFFILLAAIGAAAFVSQSNVFAQDNNVNPNPAVHSSNKSVTPTSENISAKIEEYQKCLDKTNDLLIKRSAERDSYKAEFMQYTRSKGITTQDIVSALSEKSSKYDEFSWFRKARAAWINWKDVETDISIFTRQKNRLENSITDLNLALTQFKRDVENKGTYISGEDPELDKAVAALQVNLELEEYKKSLSSTERASIDDEVYKTMTGAVDKNVFKIPGLKLTSIDNLPPLPDIEAIIPAPQDSTQKILFDSIKTTVFNRAVIKTQKEVTEYLDKGQPEAACEAWLQTIDELKNMVADASEHFESGFFDKYLAELNRCQNKTLVEMSKPYAQTLLRCLQKIEKGDDPDWTTIADSLEGFYRNKPEMSYDAIEKLDTLLKTIRMLLKSLIRRDDMNAKVIQQRLETTLEQWEKETQPVITKNIAEQLYKQAVELASHNKYDEALDKLNKAVSLFPPDSLPADCEYLIKKKEIEDAKESENRIEAEKFYKQAIELHSTKPVDALNSINEALKLFPTDSKYLEIKKIFEEKRMVKTIRGVEFAFRYCPPGTFTMGSPVSEALRKSDENQHEVTLTKGFWIMETEVTKEQWEAVNNNVSSESKNDYLPITCNFKECLNFCKKCTLLGLPIQLPTEAQWEYACRAGTTGAYAGNLDEMAWYKDNSFGSVQPVGKKKPNAWGLFDMHGNVKEWCQDKYIDYPSRIATDPQNPSSDEYDSIVNRGGCYNNLVGDCRSACRDYGAYGKSNSNTPIGFRCIIIQ